MPSYVYDDDYATCVQTYATLRIFSDDVSPKSISHSLGLQPTKSFVKGDAFGRSGLVRKFHGWFYSTEGHVASRDCRRHLDQIIEALSLKSDALRILAEQGCRADISNYWVSRGHGGPVIEHEQMERLAGLKLTVWWDVYFDDQRNVDVRT